MKDFEKIANEFIKKWIEKPEVETILLCGSYVTGNPTKNSDLDIQIILKKDVNWRERGNEVVDGLVLEYFANPLTKFKDYFEDDYSNNETTCAHMIVTGKILYSKNKENIKELKKQAKKWMNKPFKKLKKIDIENNKYHLWDLQDNLEEAFKNNKINFDYIFYNYLEILKEIYFKSIRHNSFNCNKTERLIFNEKDQKKYQTLFLKDIKFKNKFKICLNSKSKKDKMDSFKSLNKHVLNELGGFNINGWKIRNKL